MSKQTITRFCRSATGKAGIKGVERAREGAALIHSKLRGYCKVENEEQEKCCDPEKILDIVSCEGYVAKHLSNRLLKAAIKPMPRGLETIAGCNGHGR